MVNTRGNYLNFWKGDSMTYVQQADRTLNFEKTELLLFKNMYCIHTTKAQKSQNVIGTYKYVIFLGKVSSIIEHLLINHKNLT